jgi:hypothetical protein
MKNITISIPDDLYLYVRICALHRDTSVSAMVRDFLKTLPRIAEPYPADSDSLLGSAPDDATLKP